MGILEDASRQRSQAINLKACSPSNESSTAIAGAQPF